MAIKQKNLEKNFLLLKIVMGLFAVCFLILFFGSYITYKYYSIGLPNLKDITQYRPTLVNEIYSSDGQLVGRFGLEKRKLVDLEYIPEHVVKAFIAVEDKRFFEHSGLDVKGILRAFIQNIREGSVVAGGSTITQQVTKNLILTPERTLSRKIKEAILAHRIEKNLSKNEILYLYLNHIYLADGTYGVEAASNNYYGKSAKEINIAEAALLAGIPKRPERFSPRKHFDRARSRQKLILKIMYDEGFIDTRQYREAIEYNINILPKTDVNYQVAPYFVEYVRQHLEKKVGKEEYKLGGYKVITTLDIDLCLAAQWALKRGIYDYESRWNNNFIKKNLNSENSIKQYLGKQIGKEYKNGTVTNAVVTKTVDLEGPVKLASVSFADYKGEIKYIVFNKDNNPSPESIEFKHSTKYLPINSYKGIYVIPQKLSVGDVIDVRIQNIFEDNTARLEPKFQNNAQAGIVSIDSNGNVIAMAGGFEFADSQFNRSMQALRQPGSAFKPLVYSAAIDKGYTQTSVLFDMPVVIKDWEPKNYDGTYRGALVLREALSGSRNLATIRLMLDIGPRYAADYSRNFKFKSTLNPYPSLALGGSDVTLLEMVQAYSVFANGGQWVEPRFILRIYDRNNQIVEDNTGEYFVDKEKVLKKERIDKRNKLLKQLSKKKGRALPDSVAEYETIKEKEFIILDYENIEDDSSFLTAREFIELLKKSDMIFGPAKNPERIIEEDTSFIVTDLLKSVITEGTGRRASFLNSKSPVAGKTGTTNDFTDAWFVGYSPDLTTGVWVGKDNHSSLGKKEAGSRAALPIWIDFMNVALDTHKGGSFDLPDGIKLVETPYGNIPYRVTSLRENILNSLRVDKNNPNFDPINTNNQNGDRPKYGQDDFSDEAEIDFLLRR